MNPPPSVPAGRHLTTIKWLTYLMFMMFAMTTDSVGVIIPEVIREFDLSLTAASAFHYATMASMAFAGLALGFLADRLGHKRAILLGLVAFALCSVLFAFGESFAYFLALLVASGLAIGLFRSGALALIGDISISTRNHTATMNTVEGFFGVGAIIGPAIVAFLLSSGVSWKWLYVIAAALCAGLIVTATLVKYPESRRHVTEPVNLRGTLRMMKNPHAMSFAFGLFLYVAVECAIYVWMPTFFADYEGDLVWISTYAISIFFVLRAAGRFLGFWLLSRFNWAAILSLFSLAILACFAGSMLGGIETAVVLLPLSGLFMSVIYPTLNSKGISCVPKAQHGTVAGLNLFFSCLAATAGPLSMGLVSDAFGGARYGFMLATAFSGLLAVGLVLNWLFNPALKVLLMRDQQDYRPDEAPGLTG